MDVVLAASGWVAAARVSAAAAWSWRRQGLALFESQVAVNRLEQSAAQRAHALEAAEKSVGKLETELYVSQECLCIIETRANAQMLELEQLRKSTDQMEQTTRSLRAELAGTCAQLNDRESRLQDANSRVEDLERALARARTLLATSAGNCARITERLSEMQRNYIDLAESQAVDSDRFTFIVDRLADVEQLIDQVRPLVDSLDHVTEPRGRRGAADHLRLVHRNDSVPRSFPDDTDPMFDCPDEAFPATIPNLRPMSRESALH